MENYWEIAKKLEGDAREYHDWWYISEGGPYSATNIQANGFVSVMDELLKEKKGITLSGGISDGADLIGKRMSEIGYQRCVELYERFTLLFAE